MKRKNKLQKTLNIAIILSVFAIAGVMAPALVLAADTQIPEIEVVVVDTQNQEVEVVNGTSPNPEVVVVAAEEESQNDELPVVYNEIDNYYMHGGVAYYMPHEEVEKNTEFNKEKGKSYCVYCYQCSEKPLGYSSDESVVETIATNHTNETSHICTIKCK